MPESDLISRKAVAKYIAGVGAKLKRFVATRHQLRPIDIQRLTDGLVERINHFPSAEQEGTNIYIEQDSENAVAAEKTKGGSDMTEQEAREKVIADLQNEIANAVYPDRPRRFMIPLELAEQALSLLKKQAQEISVAEKDLTDVFNKNIKLEQELTMRKPRVMALEEVVITEPGTVIWLEDYDKPTIIPGLVDRVFIMTKVIDFQLVQRTVTADFDEYGDRWRCWTSSPTDAQREATPWN